MRVIIPNVLNDHVTDAESLLTTIAKLDCNGSVELDLNEINFIRPYGVVALVTVVRYLYQRSHSIVVMSGIPSRVHHYLERVDFFRLLAGQVIAKAPLSEPWERTQSTPNMLELTSIANPEDLIRVITAAEQIFSFWLESQHLNLTLRVMSELCSNIYQHSHDPGGCVFIQTHQAVSKGAVRVRLSFGDTGIGVCGSLQKKFAALGTKNLATLRAAMTGKTSRDSGRGGLGLRLVHSAVQKSGGYFWLRSEDVAVLCTADGKIEYFDQLAYMNGTQVAVDLHAPLHT